MLDAFGDGKGVSMPWYSALRIWKHGLGYERRHFISKGVKRRLIYGVRALFSGGIQPKYFLYLRINYIVTKTFPRLGE